MIVENFRDTTYWLVATQDRTKWVASGPEQSQRFESAESEPCIRKIKNWIAEDYASKSNLKSSNQPIVDVRDKPKYC